METVLALTVLETEMKEGGRGGFGKGIAAGVKAAGKHRETAVCYMNVLGNGEYITELLIYSPTCLPRCLSDHLIIS